MTTYQQIFDAAQSLSAAERWQLAQALQDSVPAEERPVLSEKWKQEIASRSTAIQDGTMSGAPWSEVRARVRKQVGLDG